jgi:hypothetical protein
VQTTKGRVVQELPAQVVGNEKRSEKIKDEKTILYFLGGLDRWTLLLHTLIREHDAGTLTLNGVINRQQLRVSRR